MISRPAPAATNLNPEGLSILVDDQLMSSLDIYGGWVFISALLIFLLMDLFVFLTMFIVDLLLVLILALLEYLRIITLTRATIQDVKKIL